MGQGESLLSGGAKLDNSVWEGVLLRKQNKTLECGPLSMNHDSKSWNLLSEWPWAKDISSLTPSYIIYKMAIINIFLDYCLASKWSTIYLKHTQSLKIYLFHIMLIKSEHYWSSR